MDLLGQSTQKKQQSKGKKIVLVLLVIAIILLIISMIAILALNQNKSNHLTLYANGNEVTVSQDMLITGENGKLYMSIEELSNVIGFDYINSGYLEHENNTNKCYIENINQVIEYQENSKEIRKIIHKSTIEDEKYNLENEIIINNNMFYIALEDLNIGCNVVYEVLEGNKLILSTADVLLEQYDESDIFIEKKLKLDKSVNNQRALSYNRIIATNSAGKMGVVDSNANSIIGFKYSTIEFNEALQNYIVSSDGKYGVISKNGKLIIELEYEEIEAINYYPLLYKVKLSDKYGILNEEGKIIVGIEYDKIGFDEKSNVAEAVTIIKNIQNNDIGIVVCNNNKYGIVNANTGKMIINCETDKIYSKKEDNKYYIELQGREVELSAYIEYINTTTVITN